MNNVKQRIASIDILRALTMVLMIFVNDLWSLKDIPGWLEHVKADEDGMGLADTVFPAFLFIVGLSIPFAVNTRFSKGDTKGQVMMHIIMRSVALLIIGVFLVNGESLDAAGTGMQRVVWNVICWTCFIILWNAYPKTANKLIINIAKVVCVAVLIWLAVIYRGGEDGNPERFAPHWWGILGLIGWAYLWSALIYVLSSDKIVVNIIAWFCFVLLCTANHAHWLPHNKLLRAIISPIGEGSMTGLVMGGVVTSQIFRYYIKQNNWKKLVAILFVIAAALMIAGFALRPIGGISKIRATPSWILICSAITIFVFIIIYWLADVKHKANWFNFIKPAGTDALLCYLLPYYAYAFVVLLSLSLPDVLLTGGIGLVKSLVFSLLMVFIAGLLSKLKIKLKL